MGARIRGSLHRLIVERVRGNSELLVRFGRSSSIKDDDVYTKLYMPGSFVDALSAFRAPLTARGTAKFGFVEAVMSFAT